MPGLKVHGESALAFAAALVHIAGCVVEYTQHRDDAVGGAAGAFDVRARGADVVDAQANTARALADEGAARQGFENACDAVVGHAEQEAGRHLWLWRTGVEQGRRGVDKPALAHQVVGFDGRVNVFAVNADGYAHEEVLRTFHHLAVHTHEVGAFEGFEAEIIELKIAVENNGRIEPRLVFLHNAVRVVADQARPVARFGVYVVIEIVYNLGEGLVGLFVQVAHGNTRGKQGIVRVNGGHGSGCFSRQVVEFDGGHAVVKSHDDLLGDFDKVDVIGIETIRHFAEARRDLVERHFLFLTAAFDYLHHDCGCIEIVLLYYFSVWVMISLIFLPAGVVSKASRCSNQAFSSANFPKV